MGTPPGAIFISYRRSDSSTESGRVYDKLVEAFGPDRVFKDVYNIPPGYDFVTYLEEAVAQCDVLMPLIGPSWLNAADAQGHRRLDDPNDFVRIEIASALSGNTLVVPTLLNGTMMPNEAALPDNLKALTRRNAVSVRQDPDFHPDMDRLIVNLEAYFESQGIPAGRSQTTVPAGDASKLPLAATRVAATPAIAPPPPTAAVPSGDAISAKIAGNVSGNIAVGKHITQTQSANVPAAITASDRAQLRQLLDTLTAQIAAEVPPEQKTAALEHLEELQETLTSAEPDLATMEYIVKWFKKKLPQLAVYVIGTVLNPLVGKVMEAAGIIAAEELRQRFTR